MLRSLRYLYYSVITAYQRQQTRQHRDWMKHHLMNIKNVCRSVSGEMWTSLEVHTISGTALDVCSRKNRPISLRNASNNGKQLGKLQGALNSTLSVCVCVWRVLLALDGMHQTFYQSSPNFSTTGWTDKLYCDTLPRDLIQLLCCIVRHHIMWYYTTVD